jgi:hypothetical protein
MPNDKRNSRMDQKRKAYPVPVIDIANGTESTRGRPRPIGLRSMKA